MAMRQLSQWKIGDLLVVVPDGDGGATNKADINSVFEVDFHGANTVKGELTIIQASIYCAHKKIPPC